MNNARSTQAPAQMTGQEITDATTKQLEDVMAYYDARGGGNAKEMMWTILVVHELNKRGRPRRSRRERSWSGTWKS